MTETTTIFDGAAPAEESAGRRLAAAREAAGLTPAQLARRLGVRTRTLHDWEAGRSEPRANRLSMLAGMLGVSPTWLLTGRGEGPAAPVAREELALLQADLREVENLQAALSAAVARVKSRVARLEQQLAVEAE
ncbi:MAG: helix-turn-helix domain-containing protein [Alphaproteobacteria bacterium]|nr:helix-turn-helix domain-containing protein [Alphaproteobacteria bacterium]MDX5370114.1 helix-turn-helix domain-containing protein [Alphaproteobacteria bacterium]MDX5464676.1 helix-turn-helix domain-containing protein [Alphaproteobacteria bacterium]